MTDRQQPQSDDAELAEFRRDTRAWLAENCPPGARGPGPVSTGSSKLKITDKDTLLWLDRMIERGWTVPSWPTAYGGGGLDKDQYLILLEEMRDIRARPALSSFGTSMIGPTLLDMGSEAQKQTHLPRIARAEVEWCQGYSEPGSGSDLASLRTRADLDGDHFVINGQKIWTSAGHTANWIFVLCRTDPDAPKHRGISFLLCPMEQVGVEVRPIEMMSGDADFNETFFTDARTHKDNVVGEVNGGWGVAMTLLGYERGEAAATTPIVFRAEFDKLVELAKLHGKDQDPVIRDRIAALYCKVEIMRLMGMQTLTKFLNGGHPGPGESTFKLYWSEYHKEITELAIDILGPAALTPVGMAKTSFTTDLPGSPNDAGSWVGTFYNARAGTIYAGTSQVQRNIIGEMVLGLPKEPKPQTTAK